MLFKLFSTLAAIATTIISAALVVAAWPVLPVYGQVTIIILLFFLSCFGLFGLFYLWALADHIRAKSQAIRLEASKIHADNSALILAPGQLVQLTPGPLGYGTVSQLRSYAPG
jgi:hypothetical protein